MKTHFICSVAFKRKTDFIQQGWKEGVLPVDVMDKESGNIIKNSKSQDRKDIFPRRLFSRIYGKKIRYHKTLSEGLEIILNLNSRNIKISLNSFQLILLDSKLCSYDIIPGVLILECDIIGSLNNLPAAIEYLIGRSNFDLENNVQGGKLYAKISTINCIKNTLLLPVREDINKFIDPFVYAVSHVGSRFPIGVFENSQGSEKYAKYIEYWSYMYKISGSKNKGPSKNVIDIWKSEKPKDLIRIGSSYAFIRDFAMCYCTSDKQFDENYFKGYINSFHIDGIAFVLLQENIINYYNNELSHSLYELNLNKLEYNKKLSMLNLEIHRVFTLYDIFKCFTLSGYHMKVMDKVQNKRKFKMLVSDALNSVNELDNIINSINDANQSEVQNSISRLGLIIAILMIFPAIIGFASDGISVFNFLVESFGFVGDPILVNEDIKFDPAPSIRNIWTGITCILLTIMLAAFFIFNLYKKK